MKKLLSILLVAVMVAAMFVPVTVSATDPVQQNAEVEYGEPFFEEEFDDPSKLEGYLANTVGGDGILTLEDGKYVEISDGALRVNLKRVGTKNSFRMKICDIPESVVNYKIVEEIKVTGNNSVKKTEADRLADTSVNASLGFSDTGLCSTPVDNSEESMDFHMLWFRPYTNSAISYGYYKNGSYNSACRCFEEPSKDTSKTYVMTVDVDVIAKTAELTVTQKDNPVNTWTYTQVVSAEAFESKVASLMFSGVSAEVYSVKVYTKNPENGQLLFSEDFSDASRFETLTNTWTDGQEGYALLGYGAHYTEELQVLKVEDNVLKARYEPHRSSRRAARILMYDLPDYINKYTVTMDVKIISIANGDGTEGTGLIINDCCQYGSKYNEEVSGFSFVWIRNTLSGLYTYPVASSGKNQATIAPATPYAAGQDLFIRVNVGDASEYDDPATKDKTETAECVVINKATGETVVKKYFVHNAYDLETIIGIYVNGGEYEFDNLNVYYGKATQLEGTNVQVGEDYTLKYTAHVSAADVAANKNITSKVTFDGKTVDTPVTVNGNNATFTFDNIAPHQMGESIKAELYADGVLADVRAFSVKENLEAVAKNKNSTDAQKAFAEAALVYGGAAQLYKNTDDTTSGEYVLPAELATPNKPFTAPTGNKILAAGLHFNNTNSIYFRFDTTDVTKITISDGDEYEVEYNIENGAIPTKIYTREIFAKELYSAEFTVKVYTDSAEPADTLTYSIYNYITNKWESTTKIAGLVKALYNYAEAAKAFAN